MSLASATATSGALSTRIEVEAAAQGGEERAEAVAAEQLGRLRQAPAAGQEFKRRAGR